MFYYKHKDGKKGIKFIKKPNQIKLKNETKLNMGGIFYSNI